MTAMSAADTAIEIHFVFQETPMTRTTLFRSNGLQAVRLPKDMAFAEGVRSVSVLRDGKCRVVVPSDSTWDDFFDASGFDLGDRDQPSTQAREDF